MLARQFCAIAGVLAIAVLGGCATEPAPKPVKTVVRHVAAPPEAPAPDQLSTDRPNFLRLSNIPVGDVPVRVGILLPFSNGSAATRALADAMLKSAELAVFESHNPDIQLMPADEGSDPGDAAAATRKLLSEGAEIIIGPLFAGSVKAVAPVAANRGVPVLAFSTDRAVGGHGIYLLSFQPEDEVRNVILYAASQGHTKFAALVPQSAYGDHVLKAFRDSVADAHAQITDVARFNSTAGDIQDPSVAVAKSAPDAVLIAQGGALLRGFAPILAASGADNQHVKYLGTGLWDDPSIAKEPMLAGGWFAAPAPGAADSFNARFRRIFGSTPPQLSTLSYDALSLVVLLAGGQPYHRFTRTALTDPNGFAGVDGIFRFEPDGTAERGLAILSVTPDGFDVVRPAPTTFQAEGE